MPNTALSTDARVKDVSLYLLPVETRVPLKFGSETLLTVTCARAKVTLEDRDGNVGVGWAKLRCRSNGAGQVPFPTPNAMLR